MKNSKIEIIQILKTEILNLTLKPGDLISEAMLTERFGLSRTPIRDILKQLEGEGYIKIYPQRGSKVSHIDLNSVEQIIYMRNALEKEIMRDLRSSITISQKLELQKILKEQEACIQESDLPAFMTQDDLFHKQCFDFVGRVFLWDVIQQFNVHYLRYRYLHMRNDDKLRDLLKEHHKLLDYLNGQSDQTIEDLMYHHLRTHEITSELAEEIENYLV